MATERQRVAEWSRMRLHRRVSVRVAREPALTCTRRALVAQREAVYIIRADRAVTYTDHRSRIVYVGTSKRGLDRMAASVARRAPSALARRGVRRIEVIPVTYEAQSAPVNLLLERALLATFIELYGERPALNKTGGRTRLEPAFAVFSKRRMRNILLGVGGGDL